jgi:hypothetical protein
MERLKKARKIRICAFIVSLILAVVLPVPRVFAETAIVDFESLATPGTGASYITTYNENGFILQEGEGSRLFYWHTDDRNFPGSTALFTSVAGGLLGYTSITREDGLLFDLKSIMLCEEEQGLSEVTLSLTGIEADNSVIDIPVTLDGTFGFETFYFDGLTSLKELRLYQDNSFFQYDQLIFNVIPEPATLVFLATGAMIMLRRKNMKK